VKFPFPPAVPKADDAAWSRHDRAGPVVATPSSRAPSAPHKSSDVGLTRDDAAVEALDLLDRLAMSEVDGDSTAMRSRPLRAHPTAWTAALNPLALRLIRRPFL